MGGKSWIAADEEIILSNSPRMTYAEIASMLGRSAKAVKNRSLSMGLLRPDPPRPFTPEEDACIRESFEAVPMSEVAGRLARHVESVRQRSRILGLSWAPGLVNRTAGRRAPVLRPGLRPDYFGKIDSPVKAYVLGLLASDGYVSFGTNAVGIKVHPKDAGLVELVRDELSPESPVRRYTQPPLPGYSTWRPYVAFSVSSAQMKADLMNLGVTPRKSHTVKYPDLPLHLENSFILGCFDGDGCLQAAGQPGEWQWHLYSASRDFLVGTGEAITRHTGLELRMNTSKRGLHCLRLNGGKSAIILDAWLHADAPGLARKRLAEGAYARAEQEAAAGRMDGGRKRSLAAHSLEDLEHARSLRAQGLTFKQVAAETGISGSVVHRWVRRSAA
jgi:DNA-binding CsgD family transcriptional regulator